MRRTGIIFAVIMALFVQQQCPAQSVSAGVISSTRHNGVAVMLSGKNGTESVIRAFTDLSNVISGKLNEPDVLADYHVMFKVFEKQVNDEFSIGFSAGPGAFAGYVVTKSSKCAVGGLSGIASLDFGFNVPITVSLGLSCEVGFCISPGYRDDYTLKLYRYGLLRSWIPELTIAYSF